MVAGLLARVLDSDLWHSFRASRSTMAAAVIAALRGAVADIPAHLRHPPAFGAAVLDALLPPALP